MAEERSTASRSAALVAACRMLAAELPEPERLIDDPFARLQVDDAAVAAARADEALQHVIRLRTRYIDDAVAAFAADHAAEPPQVVLLGAGLDARAWRLGIDPRVRVFEIDLPATLDAKEAHLAGVAPRLARTAVPVDLTAAAFPGPLVAAGFDPARPAIVVWEGVVNYLAAATATAVVGQIGDVLAPGGRLVVDYVEMGWFRGTDLERSTAAISRQLADGGEPLRAGIRDIRATLDAAGFDVVDDEALELLPPRYGLPLRPRHYPARILTAQRRASHPAG